MEVLQFVLILLLCNFCKSSRILGVIPSPSYSHQVVFQPLWKELSLRGHQVTVLTTNPINDPSLKNLTEIDLSFSYKIAEEGRSEIISSSKNFYKSFELMMQSITKVVDAQLQHPQVQKLIHDQNEHFDLLIVEYFNVAPIYFSKRFNCPYIGILSYDAPNRIHQIIGNMVHPIAYPTKLFQIPQNLNIFQRIFVSLVECYYFFVSDMYEVQAKVAKKHFRDDTPARMVMQNVSLLFVNSDPIFHHVRPLLPSVIPIGGNVARIPVEALEERVKNFLDEAHQGFIYFSLGSNVKWRDVPAHTVNVLLETFTELPYRILWKCELSELPHKPDNVMISKWVSQMEVLKHPNLKLFITHGGAQSMEESVIARVPVVGIPFFADQPFNVQKMLNLGFALSVDYRTVSKDEFMGAILEVINNDKYRNRIRELAGLVDDQPMTGLERAIWWTEYVIRRKGATHFKSPALDVPWYQYYLLDVLVVLLFSIIVCLCLILSILRGAMWLLNSIFARFKRKKD